MKSKPSPKSSAVVRQRPLWRRFAAGESEAAHAHAGKGGIAVLLRDDGGDGRLLVPRTRGGELPELAHFAVLSLGIERWAEGRPGVAVVSVGSTERDAVEMLCARDEGREGHVERVELDCLACGACCRQSRVVVAPADREAFRRAGRSDLDSKAALKTDRGETVLRHAPSGACIHFGSSNRCTIYDVRPQSCRVFPVASEPCLYARARVSQ